MDLTHNVITVLSDKSIFFGNLTFKSAFANKLIAHDKMHHTLKCKTKLRYYSSELYYFIFSNRKQVRKGKSD